MTIKSIDFSMHFLLHSALIFAEWDKLCPIDDVMLCQASVINLRRVSTLLSPWGPTGFQNRHVKDQSWFLCVRDLGVGNQQPNVGCVCKNQKLIRKLAYRKINWLTKKLRNKTSSRKAFSKVGDRESYHKVE